MLLHICLYDRSINTMLQMHTIRNKGCHFTCMPVLEIKELRSLGAYSKDKEMAVLCKPGAEAKNCPCIYAFPSITPCISTG